MQKISTFTSTLRALTVLIVSLAILLSYNFMSAAWTSAPPAPPTNNTPAPINIGTSTASIQNAGQGALQFDYLSARDTIMSNIEVRSPKYCDENGENCLNMSSCALNTAGVSYLVKLPSGDWGCQSNTGGGGGGGTCTSGSVISVSGCNASCPSGYSVAGSYFLNHCSTNIDNFALTCSCN